MDRETTRAALGLPVWTLAALSLLGAPRVVLHDMGLATGGALAAVLALGPALVWIGVTVVVRPRLPLATLLVVGIFYGVVLAVSHNVMWHDVYADAPPALGGRLDDELSAGLEAVLLRTAATVSSLFTGAAFGLVCGLAAMIVLTLTSRPQD